MADLDATLSPWAWLMLRATGGLMLLPHALQKLFGFFPESKVPANLAELAASLDNWGYRPGRLWALVVAATELIAGPSLALGLFTRFAALPIFVSRPIGGGAWQARRMVLDRARRRIPARLGGDRPVLSDQRRRAAFARSLARSWRLVPLEILDVALVFFGGRAVGEGAKIAALARLRVRLA